MTSLTYDELKSRYQNKPAINNEVTCSLLAKLKDGYLVNVNDEWEAFIPLNHLLPELENLTGSPFKALIISGPDKSDRFTVSPRALKDKAVWELLKKCKQENTITKVKISRSIKGGAEVFIDGVRAFLPGRYIRLPGISPQNWANQEITVLIEEINYEEKKLILNQRGAWELERQKQAKYTLQSLKEGDILEVPVIRTADFGVFVDLGGIDGLIPASELSWGRFAHPKDIVKIGQVLRARVFRIEKENQRIALSVKQLLGDPWEEVELDWQVGKQLKGKVIGGATFGLFVELKPGIEALLHNSEIPEGVEKPKEGSFIEAKIIKIDLEQRRIGLTFRDIESAKDEHGTKEPDTKEDQTLTDQSAGNESNVEPYNSGEKSSENDYSLSTASDNAFITSLGNIAPDTVLDTELKGSEEV